MGYEETCADLQGGLHGSGKQRPKHLQKGICLGVNPRTSRVRLKDDGAHVVGHLLS